VGRGNRHRICGATKATITATTAAAAAGIVVVVR
jgi:hypothetical protein